MRLGLALAFTLLLVQAGAARAQERPRRIWLDCAAPSHWPAPLSMPWRLSCRLQMPSSGPAFWETVNPFAADDVFQLVDPFAVEATARYVDVFEKGRYARARRLGNAIPRLIDPFVDYELEQIIDPFAPLRRKKRP
jgi:hypothetical protein